MFGKNPDRKLNKLMQRFDREQIHVHEIRDRCEEILNLGLQQGIALLALKKLALSSSPSYAEYVSNAAIEVIGDSDLAGSFEILKELLSEGEARVKKAVVHKLLEKRAIDLAVDSLSKQRFDCRAEHRTIYLILSRSDSAKVAQFFLDVAKSDENPELRLAALEFYFRSHSVRVAEEVKLPLDILFTSLPKEPDSGSDLFPNIIAYCSSDQLEAMFRDERWMKLPGELRKNVYRLVLQSILDGVDWDDLTDEQRTDSRLANLIQGIEQGELAEFARGMFEICRKMDEVIPLLQSIMKLDERFEFEVKT